MHYGLHDLEWEDVGNGWERAVGKLADGDSATNPASTNRPAIHGPAVVTYERHRTGMNIYVEEPEAAR